MRIRVSELPADVAERAVATLWCGFEQVGLPPPKLDVLAGENGTLTLSLVFEDARLEIVVQSWAEAIKRRLGASEPRVRLVLSEPEPAVRDKHIGIGEPEPA